jgi:hypothetical protein
MPTTRWTDYAPWPTTVLTPELLADAQAREADRLADGMRLAQHAHGGLVGFIGELVALDYLRAERVPHAHVDTTRHDVVGPDGTLEIKTRRRSVPLLPHYEFEVPAYSHEHQQVDFYLFVNVKYTGSAGNPTYTHADLAGFTTRDELHQYGTFRTQPVGDVLPRHFMPGWRIQQRHLRPVQRLVDWWRSYGQ